MEEEINQVHIAASLTLGKQTQCPLDGMLSRVRLIINTEYIFIESPLIEYKGNIIFLIRIVIEIS
jgi:hypothetical protein